MTEHAKRVRTPWFPPYSSVAQLLTILDGVAKSKVADMLSAMWDQRGTPQNPTDWSDPDVWITERLSGDSITLARCIWEKSNHNVNPRHIQGATNFANNYGLLIVDSEGVYRLSERGKSFLDKDPDVLRELDDTEGILQLLLILAPKTRAKRGELLPEWGEYLKEHSNFDATSTIRDALWCRLKNVSERGLVARDGQFYSITNQGIEYASKADPDPKKKVLLRNIAAFKEDQKKILKDRLGRMHPAKFEHLVRDLLEEMGYEDVRVTGASGDRGVDVVATIQFGITTITEVVQVKRHHNTIGRQVLDQFRGSLHYHKAIRGTLISLGRFSSGCKESAILPGAAPIGLIDGDHLIELLFEHKVGIKERPAILYEIDEDYFNDSSNDLQEQDDEIPSISNKE
ncbi:MAG: restriction endonuclease [Methanosarcinales archaeon]|jgi:restriction system protein|nr:restriction endonuclease [Methanosarcinales archaeon]